MDIEEIEIDEQLITVSLPVSDIRIDEYRVIYQDSTGVSQASFSSKSWARQFAAVLADL